MQNETIVNEVQDMSQKVTNREVLIRFRGLKYFSKYAENPHIYQAPECNCFIAARAIGTLEALFNVHIYFKISWRLIT